jgi:hypothetical protein
MNKIKHNRDTIRKICVESFNFYFLINILLFLVIFIRFYFILMEKGGFISNVSNIFSYFTFNLFLKYRNK